MDNNLNALCALALISEKARFQAERCTQPLVKMSLLEIDQHAKSALAWLRSPSKQSWSACNKCNSRNADEAILKSSSKFTCRHCGNEWMDHYGGER